MIINDHYTLLVVATCTAFLGMATGIIGSFTFLREQSLLGDAVAHACLPGTALAFLLTSSTQPAYLMLGSLIAGLCAIGVIKTLQYKTHFKMDLILGGTLSVFFGFGLVCMSIAQKHPLQQPSLFTSIIFGNAATLFVHDSIIAATVALTVLGCIWFFWKELLLVTFDSSYALSCGYKVRHFDALLTLLLAITIAIGLPMVGVILMSTMLIAPAAAARLWNSRFTSFVMCSGLFGALFSIVGVLISACCYHAPTGPVIAIVAVTWVLVSLVIKQKTQ